jgi:hypothetical protein
VAYSIVDFAKSLHVDKCRIQKTPNLIFLCGGPVGKKGPSRSARDFFLRHVQRRRRDIAARTRLAEDVNAGFDRKLFPDLLELENYLAGLADVTLLFVESSGSIAELGAFAASEVLRPKLLVVVNTRFRTTNTFIADGPVQKVKNEDESLVHYFPWNPRALRSASTKRQFREMTRVLLEFLDKPDRSTSTARFLNSREKHGSVILLVADLVRIAGVATITDVHESLLAARFEVSREESARYLSLLESVGFVQRALRSNQTLFLGLGSTPFLRYAFAAGTRLKDRRRIQSEIRLSLGDIPRRLLRDFVKSRKGARRV